MLVSPRGKVPSLVIFTFTSHLYPMLVHDTSCEQKNYFAAPTSYFSSLFVLRSRPIAWSVPSFRLFHYVKCLSGLTGQISEHRCFRAVEVFVLFQRSRYRGIAA